AGARGTRVTLIAGTHGDEGPRSALAIKKLCRHPVAKLTGRLRVIFTANALAAEVERRNSWIDSPNSVDLDGVFPGKEEGSHTERLAGSIAPLIADSNVVIDLHGGGTWCVNAFVKRFEGSEQLAADLGAPVGGIFVPSLREDAVGTIVPAGTEMGKILDLHTLAELQIFTAPYEQTAMMLMRPQICTIEGSALVYVVARPA